MRSKFEISSNQCIHVGMTQSKKHRPSTHKVRRDVAGGKRGIGKDLQRQGRKVRRPNPSALRAGRPDASLTGVAGLVPYNSYLRSLGVDATLAKSFARLKPGASTVYPMASQMRLLTDAHVAGEGRVFGLEALAADPLFVHLAGGTIPALL